MSILPGRRLGPYETLSAIGAGGMGEVYKARDTRLDRIVAIKVLPAHLADRAELRERFEREAKTIASLNHPHICTLYDTGHQDDIDFLVMEYIEGETLAQRLAKGALPIQQVLQYAIEIADALDKAHRKGITHRDLKPGNIMLTKSGTKLLDFGLAKLKQEAAPATPESQLTTMKDAITGEGTILGTPQYMAPEQVEGKTDQIDARTDIFVFGAVVYEMATGKLAFEGRTSASVMAKILEAEPPSIASLQPMTPPAFDRVVTKCLAKEPEKRWQAASDVCDELKWIAEGGSHAGFMPTAAANATRPKGRSILVLSAVALLLLAIATGLAIRKLKLASTTTPPVTRTVINLPPGDQLAALDFPALALSPDGSQLAYVAIRGGVRQIYLRPLDSLEARPIAGTEGANTPFFSPDGQWLGFFTGGMLKKISVSGGETQTLATATFPFGASWSSNGTIAFGANAFSGLQRVSDTGGAQQALTVLGSGESFPRSPEFLPGGGAVLYVLNSLNPRIAVQSFSTGQRRDLVTGGSSPRYAASGHLLYSQAGNLTAVPFDAQQLQVNGPAVPLVNSVLQTVGPLGGNTQYSISAGGSLAYVPGGVQGAERLVWVSRNGAEQVLAAPPHDYAYFRISPDGHRVAVTVKESGGTQLWLYDIARDTLSRATFEGGINQGPVWTPDGQRITFVSNKEGPLNIFWQRADGSGGLERLTTSENTNTPMSWSNDGKMLAFIEVNPTTGWDIWVLRLSDHKVQPFLRTQFNEGAPRFSPDGHWLAYISDESGRNEVYVQPYPGPGGKWQMSTDGGTEPVWNPNGRELFYRSGNKMMAVDVATLPSFSAGKPHELFEGSYLTTQATFPFYDVSADGQRFLMIKRNEQATSLTQIVLVQNWFEELKQKVPGGKN